MLPNSNSLPDVSRETYDNLKIYYDLLLRWQKKINLISDNCEDDVWQRHFEDALQLDTLISENAQTLYDLGSGAGFPGLVLALSTNKDVTLVESDSRKCSFLRAVSRETNAQNVSVQNCRIESLDLPAPDIITARALAPLVKLMTYCWGLWGNDCNDVCFLFPKGKNWEAEVEEAKKSFKFDLKIHDSKTSNEAKILEILALCCV